MDRGRPNAIAAIAVVLAFAYLNSYVGSGALLMTASDQERPKLVKTWGTA